MKQTNRGPQSASPVCMNRRHNEGQSSDSNREMDNELTDINEDNVHEYMDKCSDETPQDIIENDLEEDSQTDSAPTAPTGDDSDLNAMAEKDEDLSKGDLKELIYKLFLNIYNSEAQSIEKLKKVIFPKIDEKTRLDDYITYAISNCMDHVKDELQSYIKKNLKFQKKKSDAPQKSMINDLSFVPVSESLKHYNEIIDKIIDFYELFKCSIENIVEVWKSKLGHIDKLYEIFEFRHKKLFHVNIWQENEIISVMKLYFDLNQQCTDKEYLKRVEDLKRIDEDLCENNQCNGRDVGTNGRKGKKSGKNKNKNKNKKKNKDGITNFNVEKDDEKLYEINDIEKLCDIIENSDKSKKNNKADLRNKPKKTK